MLNLSSGTIKLSKSRYFTRLAIFVHSAALYILWCSAWLLSGKLCISLILISMLCMVLLNPSCSMAFTQLDFQSGKWFLYDKNGWQFTYERHRVILEAGIFFLLELSNSEEKTTKTVFFDQFPAEDYRALKLLEKTY